MAYVVLAGNWLLPLLYFGLVADYAATFFLRTRSQARSPQLAAVILVHLAVLGAYAVHCGHPPVTHTSEILSVVAFATAAVYGYVEFVGRDRRTGLFVLLLVLLFQYTSSVLLAGCQTQTGAAQTAQRTVWLRLHVLPALVAYVAMALAGVYGGVYLAAQRGLRRHTFGVLFDRLPPLDLLERMTWHALITGFVFMTAAIAIAPLLFRGEGPQELTPKVVSKIVTGSAAWLVCGAAVAGRWVLKWPAGRVAAIAVAGFLTVVALLAASGLLS